MTAPGSPTAPADPQAPGYPPARRDDLAEDLHGQRVPDPYRWLEDAASADTQEWLAAQDTLWAAAEAGLPGRSRLAARLQELMAAGYVGAPAWRGPRQFFMRRLPGQEHGALLTAAPGEPERVLIDPAALDPAGLTTLDSWQPDQEGRLLAYQLSSGGDEESELRVLDVVSGEQVDGPISRCRYSPVAWLPGGKAFYYVRKLPPDQVPPGEEQFHRRVYLHTVGTPAEEDVLIFGAGRDKTNYYGVSVSRDGRWLVISAAQGTAPRNDVWLADLTASGPAAPLLQVVQEGVDARTGVHVGRDGRLYVFTDAGAPRGRLAVADPAHPEPDRWRDLVGQDPAAILTDFAILDGAGLDRPVLVVSWTRHADQRDHRARPGHRRADGHAGPARDRPRRRRRPAGDHRGNQRAAGRRARGVVRLHRQHHPGGRVPLRRAQRGGLPLGPGPRRGRGTGRAHPPGDVHLEGRHRGRDAGDQCRPGGDPPDQPRPAILYGYGGFGISMVPAYSASILAWVEAGGVYAIAALRGGGEEGEDWHRAGMREHKQAVFDDFHAAAEALIAGGWTTPGQLGISGGSNGGLLVGAALTQRPDLYRAVVCSAPLLDMVRYERFGLGQTWNDEYGTRRGPGGAGLAARLLPVPPGAAGHPVPGHAVHRVRQRHPGRPGARVEDVRRAAARDVGAVAGAPGPAPPGAGGGPRRPRGQPVGHAVRGHAGLPRRPDRPEALSGHRPGA